ncbi:MAG: DUF222 domain-containing protein [Microthrixaceae bacterium]|nr:DUF222 domain-containing protein [Microthrixaceae bacterium]
MSLLSIVGERSVGQGSDLRAEVVAVGRSWSSAQHRLVVLLARLDRGGEWALDGAATCAHWVAGALDVEVSTAREWLRVGHALEDLARIDASFSEGRISYSKVRQLTRVATVDNEAALLEIAERTPAGRLGAAIARWLGAREDPAETERRQHAARSLSWRTDPDGMVVAMLRLPPLAAAVLMAAVDAWVLRNRPAATPVTGSGPDASADASLPRSVVGWPSVAQQRADGLVALVEGEGASVQTEVILHVRGDGCTLDDGTPVAGSLVERIASGAFLRVLIHDAQRRPINASGRQRHPSERQKRVVHERDKGCVDCGATSLLEYDHEPDYSISGHTIIEELRERCWGCHRARHQRQEGQP